MNALSAFLIVIFLAVVGFAVIKGLDILPKKSNLYIFSLGYGLGVGLISAQMYIYARLGILWNVTDLLAPWIVVLLMVCSRKKRYKKLLLWYAKTKNINFRKMDTVSIGLLIGIIISVLYTIFEALLRPLAVWDGLATWMIKSKAFFLDNSITIPTLRYIASDGPLVVSLLGAFVYEILGKVDDTAVLLPSAGFYVFLLILFYSALRERQSSRSALFFTFLLAMTQTLIRQGGRMEAGQADLPLGYFIFSSTLLFCLYMKSGSSKVLMLLSLFLGIAALTKFEGLPFALLILGLVVYEVFKKNKQKQLPLLLFSIIPIIEWQIYKHAIHLDAVYLSGHTLVFSIQKIQQSFIGTLKELVNIKSWNLLWIVYFYCLIFFFQPKNREIVILHLVVLSQLGLYLIIYFFTFGNSPDSSIERLLAHLAPVALYVTALIAASTFNHFDFTTVNKISAFLRRKIIVNTFR